MLPEYNRDNAQHTTDIMDGKIHAANYRASSGSIPKFGYKERDAQQEGKKLIQRTTASEKRAATRKKQKQEQQGGAESQQRKVRVG